MHCLSLVVTGEITVANHINAPQPPPTLHPHTGMDDFQAVSQIQNTIRFLFHVAFLWLFFKFLNSTTTGKKRKAKGVTGYLEQNIYLV